MKSSFLRSWMNFDLFGIMPSMSFNGKSKSKTSVGSVFSSLLLFYMMFAIYQSFQNLVFRQNPNIVTSTTEGSQTDVNFGQNFMNIGFTLIHPFSGEVQTDPSIVQMHFLKVELSKADLEGNIYQEGTTTILQSELCTPEHFGGHFSIPGYCLSMDQNTTLGIVSQEVLIAYIRKCNNATSPVPCQDQDVIDNIFNSHQLTFAYPEYYLQPNNFDEPLKVKAGYYAMQSSATLSKQMRIAIQEYEFETDSGIILPSVESQTRLEVESFIMDVMDDGLQELTAVIHMTGNKVTQTRSYMKLQQALAGSVALIRIGILAFGIFLLPFTRVVYYKNLINSLFSARKPLTQIKKGKGGQVTDAKLVNGSESPQFKIIQRRNSSSSVYSSKTLKQAANISNSAVPLNFDDSINQSTAKLKGKPSPFKSQAQGNQRNSLFQSSLQVNEQDLNNSADLESGSVNGEPFNDISKKQEEENQNSNDNSQNNEKDQNEDSLAEKDNNTVIEIQQQLPQELVPMGKIVSDAQSEGEQTIRPIKSDEPFTPNKKSRFGTTSNETSAKTTTNDLLQEDNIINETPVKIWFRKFFGCQGSHGAQKYNMGRSKISEMLSVDRILENLRDVDRLKLLFFDETQRVIFDHLPKPELMAPIENENALEKAAQLNPQIDYYSELGNYYKKLAGKEYKTPLDKKLIKWFENGYYDVGQKDVL